MWSFPGVRLSRRIAREYFFLDVKKLHRLMLMFSCRILEAIDFAKPYQPDAFLAVGGGSVIDTAKLM